MLLPVREFVGSTAEKRSVGDVSGGHARVVVAGAEEDAHARSDRVQAAVGRDAWRRAAAAPRLPRSRPGPRASSRPRAPTASRSRRAYRRRAASLRGCPACTGVGDGALVGSMSLRRSSRSRRAEGASELARSQNTVMGLLLGRAPLSSAARIAASLRRRASGTAAAIAPLRRSSKRRHERMSERRMRQGGRPPMAVVTCWPGLAAQGGSSDARHRAGLGVNGRLRAWCPLASGRPSNRRRRTVELPAGKTTASTL